MPILKGITAAKGMHGGNSCIIRVEVENDPTSTVKSVDVYIQSGSPAAEPSTVKLPATGGSPSGIREFSATAYFTGDPVNQTYTMQSTMKDVNDKKIGSSSEQSVMVEPATVEQPGALF